MKQRIGIHAIISGKVQGVCFRDSTRQQAQQLKITGWVKNLISGEVELTAYGEQKNMQQFIDWLWRGPTFAIVKNVDWEEIEYLEISDFEVRYE